MKLAQALLNVIANMSMRSRLVACWLIVLIVTPFTAPFPTCDLPTLLGRSGEAAHSGVPTPSGASVARHAGSPTWSMRFARRHVRDGAPAESPEPVVSNDAAVLTAPALFRSNRSRLLPLARANRPLTGVSPPSATFLQSATRMAGLKNDSTLGTILRL